MRKTESETGSSRFEGIARNSPTQNVRRRKTASGRRWLTTPIGIAPIPVKSPKESRKGRFSLCCNFGCVSNATQWVLADTNS